MQRTPPNAAAGTPHAATAASPRTQSRSPAVLFSQSAFALA